MNIKLVDLNKVTVQEIMDSHIPGVGIARATAIVAYRLAHGGFQDISELMEVNGIGPLIYVTLTHHCFVSALNNNVRLLELQNSAGAWMMLLVEAVLMYVFACWGRCDLLKLQTGNFMIGSLLCVDLIFIRILTEAYEAAIIFVCCSYIQGSLIVIPLQRYNMSTSELSEVVMEALLITLSLSVAAMLIRLRAEFEILERYVCWLRRISLISTTAVVIFPLVSKPCLAFVGIAVTCLSFGCDQHVSTEVRHGRDVYVRSATVWSRVLFVLCYYRLYCGHDR